ncbi:Sugar phosphate isomerase/epimerase [[Bacillus] enclensis]|uniref:Sugar phosphate isomerase/epimerase n=1 Tax=[Bacillus] enclensis TaxID=1402860 RepID=A0A1C4CX52_9BACI|nr:Sugar phosphate isomerase/epimerase [[Bacillus] enclensis]
MSLNYLSNYQKLLEKHQLKIEALTMHRDSQLIMGPHGDATQRFFKGTPDEQVEYGKQRLMKAAEVANEYGIPKITGFMGAGEFSSWYPWPHSEGWKQQQNLAYERWMPILEYYEKLGVKFAHEVGPQQLAYNLETTQEILEILNIDSFGICFDPSNFILTGVNPCIFVEEIGSKIFHVHGKDSELTHHVSSSGWMAHGDLSRPDRGFRFRIPGWGDVNWKKVLTTLKLNGYNDVISIEIEDPTMDSEEALEKTIDHLKPLLFK